MATECSDLTGKFPYPPKNGTAMSALTPGKVEIDIRWDDPSDLNTGPEGVHIDETTVAAVDVVVNGTPTVLSSATGSLTVVSAPIPAGETVSIDQLVLIASAGPPANVDEFDGSSPDAAVVAGNLTAAINNGSIGDWGVCTAEASGTHIALTAGANTGEEGNGVLLESSTAQVVPSGSSLSGGTYQTVLTVGEYELSAVDGDRTPGGSDFDINDAGASIAEALNDPKNPFSFVTASWGGTCVRIQAATRGLSGNGIPVSSNSDTLFPAFESTKGGTGTPCPLGEDNSQWNILGVNVYRSNTGERGPYFRVNKIPLGSQFFRDRTDIVEVPAEVVSWTSGWVFKGDSPNNKGWRIQTTRRPVVKKEGNAVPANSPLDVEVYVDGARAVVAAVFGPTGEIDLSTEQVWNPGTDSWDIPTIPTETSLVQVRYYHQNGPKILNTLDQGHRIFYRITSVATDPTGTSPTGLVETPLEYSPPISSTDSEKIDWIWKEAVRRNRFILQQGGEIVKLFIRRGSGNRCQCVWDAQLQEFLKQPMNNCLMCYGTGWIGGYEGPYDILVGPDESERRVSQTLMGRRLENSYEVWIGPSPRVSQRDFLVKQNGERFSIGPVRRTGIRGVTLQQAFTIAYLDSTDIRYQVPMSALERLPWPKTRQVRPEDSPCEDAAPYPVGADYQATPMATEKKGIPDSRELRGRTPVYQNTTYGGEGGW